MASIDGVSLQESTHPGQCLAETSSNAPGTNAVFCQECANLLTSMHFPHPVHTLVSFILFLRILLLVDVLTCISLERLTLLKPNINK